MKTRSMLTMFVGVLLVVMAQARHPNLTRRATPSDPTFDLVISYWGNPDGDNNGKYQDPINPSTQDKIENIIGYYADGIYEATEGQHRLKKVYIFTNDKSKGQCDILWKQNAVGEARYTIDKLGASGRIIFGDVRPKKGGGEIDTLNNLEDAGFSLAHESGHYLYGLFDEYYTLKKSGQPIPPDEVPDVWRVPYSLMTMPPGLDRAWNYDWLNFSVKNRGGTTNAGFGKWENTKLTKQHQIHGASGWETLIREPEISIPDTPSTPPWWQFFLGIAKDPDPDPDPNDPGVLPLGVRNQIARNLFPRPYYPELATVAPQGNNLPTIQLPGAAARGVLDIIWMQDPVIQIVLDRSGSMDGAPWENAKAAAQSLIDFVGEDVSVGVLVYSNVVSEVAAIVKVTNDMVRAELKDAIAGVTVVMGEDAMGDAMQTALDGLRDYGISNRVAAVFLFGDGGSYCGVDPRGMASVYREAKIPVLGFGYGKSEHPILGYDWKLPVDPLLEEVTTATGGRYFFSPAGYNGLQMAFVEANAILADLAVILNGDAFPVTTGAAAVPMLYTVGNGKIQAQSGSIITESAIVPVHTPFSVEPDTHNLRVSVVYSGAGASEVSLDLMRPDGTLVTAAPTNAPDGSTLMAFLVDSPEAGEWAIVGEHPSDTPLSCFAYVKGGSCRLDWIAFEPWEETCEHLTVVSLSGEGSIDGAHVTGEIRFDNGETVSCVFTNFATGLYGVMNRATHTGYGTMFVTADNPNGTAIMTWLDTQIEADADGDTAPPEDVGITENFSRTISQRIYVEPYPCLFVDANQPDDSKIGNSWEEAFKSLQTAIDRASGDTTIIAVTNGVYGPISATGIKRITIQSVNGAEVTVIDGGGTNRCATLGEPFGAINTVLNGFTLRNGRASDYGGGVYYGVLSNCVLSGNTSMKSGGGAYFCTLENCILSGNTAVASGGGAAYGTLNNCLLSSNTANYSGGGAYHSSLDNCVLVGNTATNGGGVYYGSITESRTLNNCMLACNTAINSGGAAYFGILNNCTLTKNTATVAGGAYRGTLNNCTLWGNTAGYYGGGSYNSYLDNCIVWGNTANVNYSNQWNGVLSCSCTAPLPTASFDGGGNIKADPLFVDAANGDFRLEKGSPCINMGTNQYAPEGLDLAGNPRIIGDAVDMGAYEYGLTRNTPVKVPYWWLDEYGVCGSVDEYEGLAVLEGANDMLYWESYVAGLVPTDAASKFQIVDFKADGASVVALNWTPHLSNRVYKVWGKTKLTDSAWHCPTNAETRFFQVKVSLP